jgi:hypothetical protein
MDQRHSLGGVQAGELYRYKAIQLLEALVAADLLPITGFGYLLYHRFEDCFVYRRSFVLVPVCTPRLVDVPGRPDLTSSKSAEHIIRREPLDLHPSLQSLAGVVEELVERVAVRIHAVGYSLQGHAAERVKQRKALPLRQILVDKAPEIREDYALRCRQLGVRYRVCRRDGVSPWRSITSSNETSRHRLRRISANAVRTQIFCAQTVKRLSPEGIEVVQDLQQRLLREVLDGRLDAAHPPVQGGPQASHQQAAQVR